jgi:uncharacterized protein YraI
MLLALLLTLLVAGTANAAPTSQDARFATPVAIVNTSFLNVRTGPGIQYSVLITVVGGTSLQVTGIAGDGVWLQVDTAAGLGWLNSQYVLARGNFEFVPLVSAPRLEEVVAASSYSGASNNTDDTAVDMGFSSSRLWGVSVSVAHPARALPDPGATEVRFMNPSGNIYAVANAAFGGGTSWIQVSLEGIGLSWLEQSKVMFRPYGCGFSVVQITQDISLKRGPDGSGTDQVTVAGGQEAYLLDLVSGLYKVELMDGTVGWVEQIHITIRDQATIAAPTCVAATTESGTGAGASAQAAISGAYVVVNTGNLNVRSGAGAQYASVATVAGGTRLSALGFAPDGVWILVAGDFGRGWVNEDFLLFRGDARSLPVITDTAGQSSVAPTVTETNGTGGGGTSAPAVSGAYVVVNTGYLNIRSGAGAQFSSVATVPGGTRLGAVGFAPDGVWILVQGSFGSGWVNGEFVLFRGDARSLPVVTDTIGQTEQPSATTTANVTVYAAANLTLGRVGDLAAGTVVTAIGRTPDFLWVQINSPIGIGWVQRDFLRLSGNTAVVPVVGG